MRQRPCGVSGCCSCWSKRALNACTCSSTESGLFNDSDFAGLSSSDFTGICTFPHADCPLCAASSSAAGFAVQGIATLSPGGARHCHLSPSPPALKQLVILAWPGTAPGGALSEPRAALSAPGVPASVPAQGGALSAPCAALWIPGAAIPAPAQGSALSAPCAALLAPGVAASAVDTALRAARIFRRVSPAFAALCLYNSAF